ncbi:MAG: MBL fold metallo-hydrolase [Pseudomonadales bacterium]|nr:MBL fold metallo-hydrolase [Pseudomonadales bacterium]
MATDEIVDARRFSEAESSPRIGRIPTPTGYAGLGDINSYLIFPEKDSDELILIDTGINSKLAWKTLNEGLAKLGYRVEDITKILLTHGHNDHCGQARHIREKSGCIVWAHEDLELTINRFNPSPELKELEQYFYARWGVEQEAMDRAFSGRYDKVKSFQPVEIDHLLKDDELVEISGFNLRTVHTPGHCPDEVIYWQEEERVIFSGDHLLPHITPVTLAQIPVSKEAVRPQSLIQYQASLTKVEPYPARVTYPSHGGPITDHLALINSYRGATDRRLLKISRILEEGGLMNPMEVGKSLFPRAWKDQLVPVMSEILGHCDLLQEDGHVAEEVSNGVIQYRYISTPTHLIPAPEAAAVS